MATVSRTEVDARLAFPTPRAGAAAGVVSSTTCVRTVRRLVQAAFLQQASHARHGGLVKEATETFPVEQGEGPSLRRREAWPPTDLGRKCSSPSHALWGLWSGRSGSSATHFAYGSTGTCSPYSSGWRTSTPSKRTFLCGDYVGSSGSGWAFLWRWGG